MPKTHAILELHRHDARMLVRMERVEAVCLAAAVVIAAASLATTLFPAIAGSELGWAAMPLLDAVAAVTCAIGLELSTMEGSPRAKLARICLGVLTAGLGVAIGLGRASVAAWLPKGLNAAQAAAPGRITWLVAVAFVCLGIVILFAQAGKGREGWAPDAALFGAAWAVLTLVAGATFGGLHLFGEVTRGQVAPGVTLALVLLTAVAVGRRAEYGRFSIFVGRGLSSRIARGILPVVLLLPVSRELARARMMRTHVLPDHYAAAILAATGTMIAMLLLLVVVWQLRQLEWEIQSLSLRDELTGLYNLRGFHLLAEQALRMARRSRLPFSVLFVDVDNLKKINDKLGHAAGSQLLVEAAEFLKTNFRETDVLGRLGGDEFAVAGQFSFHAIEQAEERLRNDSAENDSGDSPCLSLSMGHVTADPRRDETLEDLLERADAAMYERKRLKKLQTV